MTGFPSCLAGSGGFSAIVNGAVGHRLPAFERRGEELHPTTDGRGISSLVKTQRTMDRRVSRAQGDGIGGYGRSRRCEWGGLFNHPVNHELTQPVRGHFAHVLFWVS